MAFDTSLGIPYHMDLDIHNIRNFEKIYAKQYDKESRFIECQLLNNDNIYTIPDGTSVIFGCKKRSQKIVESPATIQDNMIYYRLEEQVTAVDGEVEAEFTLTFNGVTLGCPKFKIIVEKAAIDALDIADNDDVNVLSGLVSDATIVVAETITATINANAAAQKATNAAGDVTASKNYALQSEGWAVGTSSISGSLTNNSKYYSEQAANSAQLASQYATIIYPNLYIDIATGELISSSGQNINFTIDSEGYLISEITV